MFKIRRPIEEVNYIKTKKIKRKCLNCDKIIFIYKDRIKRGRGKFCSRKCLAENKKKTRIILECKNCGKKYWVHNYRKYESNFCSKDCSLNYTSLPMNKNKNNTTYIINNFLGKRQHRIIAEKFLNRKLNPKEVIHHINGNKGDNRIENLYLFNNLKNHSKYHLLLLRDKIKKITKSNLCSKSDVQ